MHLLQPIKMSLITQPNTRCYNKTPTRNYTILSFHHILRAPSNYQKWLFKWENKRPGSYIHKAHHLSLSFYAQTTNFHVFHASPHTLHGLSWVCLLDANSTDFGFAVTNSTHARNTTSVKILAWILIIMIITSNQNSSDANVLCISVHAIS